jgi:hypothetical protein
LYYFFIYNYYLILVSPWGELLYHLYLLAIRHMLMADASTLNVKDPLKKEVKVFVLNIFRYLKYCTGILCQNPCKDIVLLYGLYQLQQVILLEFVFFDRQNISFL